MDEPTIRRYPRTLIEAFPQDYAESIERPPRKWTPYKLTLLAVYAIMWVMFFSIFL